MDRELARQEIRRNWRRIIPSLLDTAKRKVNRETSYICPCGHGAHGDGLTVNPKSSDGCGLKCFGCGWSGDIISLYQKLSGADYNSALSHLAQEIGISIDAYNHTANKSHRSDAQNKATKGSKTAFCQQDDTEPPPAAKRPPEAQENPENATVDFSQYYKECHARLTDPEALAYINHRGISLETASAYMLGFDPQADPANNPGGGGISTHPCPRLIIPTCTSHYVGRRIDGEQKFAKINPKDATPGIFNMNALYSSECDEVFVTEGVFDALSIIEAGAPAIALSSTSNVDLLLRTLKQAPCETTLILCLDADKAGFDAQEKLASGLSDLEICFVRADICQGYKDPNDALSANKDAFLAQIERAKHLASPKPDNIAHYIDHLMNEDIACFTCEINTGYSNLDEKCAGLYAGLYCIAAISSLGKTTFAAQMADQIAAAGHNVLFFSLEQSRLELVSKSIARVAAQKDLERTVTSLSIRKGYSSMNVRAAVREYKTKVADHLSIIEGNFDCSADFIANYVKNFIRRTKTRPVVFIDYLQILQGASHYARQSAKEIIDNTVTQLKRISRELNLTIFIISSVNRTNYSTPIDFESLKESGGIEYTCDVIWGLQLQCLNEPLFEKPQNVKERRERIKQAKSETPRKIELVCLKNRYGPAAFTCHFDYFPACDLFLPSNATQCAFPPTKKAGRRL